MNSTRNETSNINLDVSSFDWAMFIITDTLLLLGLIGFMASVVIVTVIWKYPALKQKEGGIYMIGFLAVADGTYGCGCTIVQLNWFRIMLFQVTKYTNAECLSVFMILMCGQFLSQVMIIWIAVDRLTAVRNPLKYLNKDHAKFAKQSFSLTLLFAVVVHSGGMCLGVDLGAQPPFFNIVMCVHAYYIAYINLFSVFTSVTILVTYAIILCALYKKTNTTVTVDQQHLSDQLEIQARLTKTVSTVVAIYCLFWITPTYMYMFANIAGVSRPTLAFIANFIGIGGAASAASNIFVYAYKMPTFREYLKKFFKGQKDSGSIASNRGPGNGQLIQVCVNRIQVSETL